MKFPQIYVFAIDFRWWIMFLIQIATNIILFMLKISVAKHTICQVGKIHLIIIHCLLGGFNQPL